MNILVFVNKNQALVCSFKSPRGQDFTFLWYKKIEPYNFLMKIHNLKCFQHVRLIYEGLEGHFGCLWLDFAKLIQSKAGFTKKMKSLGFAFLKTGDGWDELPWEKY